MTLPPIDQLTASVTCFSRFGGPEAVSLVHRVVARPSRNEVIVRVAAATVNPTDLMMLKGEHLHLMRDLAPPFVAGMEFAGHVCAIGPDNDPELPVGQPVMGIVNPRRPRGGAHASLISVPSASVAPLPKTADLVLGATVPMNALTATMCLDFLHLPPQSTLLVTGAGGAVGAFVVQFARAAGIRVIAGADAADRALLFSLGAAEVVQRGEAFVASVQSLHPRGVDGLVDCALLGDRAAALVRDGGAAVSLRRSHAFSGSRLRHTVVSVLEQVTNTAALRSLATLFAEGKLAARVAERIPLGRAKDAFSLVERGGLRGRVVLIPDGRPEPPESAGFQRALSLSHLGYSG